MRKHSVLTRCGSPGERRVDLRCVLVAGRSEFASGLDIKQDGKEESRLSRVVRFGRMAMKHVKYHVGN